MAKQLFPKAFISASIEYYTFRIRNKSRAIYLTLLISLCTIVVVLPLIGIKVTTLGHGVIATSDANFILQAPVSASLVNYRLRENRKIQQGDTLATFHDTLLDREIVQIENRKNEVDQFITDLALLINNRSTDSSTSASYIIAEQQYQSGLQRLVVKHNSAAKTYRRQRKLYQQQVIPATELQRDQEAMDLAKAEIDFYIDQTMNIWKQELLSYEQELRELTLRKEQLENEIQKYVMIAPASGELQQVASLTTGQLVQAGMKLGEVSIDTTLLAICWIPPRDIGLIKEQMKTTIRIDAYNANDWGFMNGEVSSISSDAYMINNQPYFKVECALKQDHLMLKNGFVGKLKKGMTLQASFQVARRSLYQLLYDKVEDWLNPELM